MDTTPEETVVVAVDGSADGERAVRYGAALARSEGLRLRLVHVPQEFAPYAPMMPYVPVATYREIGETVLHDATVHAEKAGLDAHRISTVLVEGPRVPALLDHAEDARCVVLGTRSSALHRLLTGSTSTSVAAHATVPVHCVPAAWSEHADTHGRIVVGIDGSRADQAVLREAFALAAARQADLEIVHAWRPVSPYDVAITGRVLHDDWGTTTRDLLARGVTTVADAVGSPVAWELRMEYERPAVALHEAAERADLLVLGRHAHPLVHGLLVGSVTRTLLHAATCPVVVVPTPADNPDGRDEPES